MTTHEVTARRSGDWWALEVPSVPGAFSQVKRLDQARETITEAIAMILDIDEDDITVEVRPELPEDLASLVERAHHLKAEQERVTSEVRRAQRQTINALIGTCHLSHRDVGEIVGLSHQRVSQVLKETSDA